MEYYDPADIVLTHLGNKVSRRCAVYGTQNIVLSGQVTYFFARTDFQKMIKFNQFGRGRF